MNDKKRVSKILERIRGSKDVVELQYIAKQCPGMNEMFILAAEVSLFYLTDYKEKTKGKSIKQLVQQKIHKDFIPPRVWGYIIEISKEQDEFKIPSGKVKVRGDYVIFSREDIIPASEVNISYEVSSTIGGINFSSN